MKASTQPTSWEVPEAVWTLIAQVLNAVYAAKPTRPRRVHRRRVLNGLIVRLRPGCQWNQRPQRFGDDRPGHRHVQRWCDLGVCEQSWAVRIHACEAWGGVDWPWPAAARGKARLGGDRVGCHPTDRGETGASAAWWWKPRAVPWGAPWPEPTGTPPRGSRPRAIPSVSSGQPPRPRPRNIAGAIRATSTPRAIMSSRRSTTRHIVVGSARNHALHAGERASPRGGGLLNAHGPGVQRVVRVSCETTRMPATSWSGFRWHVLYAGSVAGHD
jgi:transposase